MWRFSFLAVLLLTLPHLSCKKDSPSEPTGPVFPPLADPIPYAQLGQGRLVFERIGPFTNSYSGVYVVDAAQKRSWGISGGDIDGPAVSPDGQSIVYTTGTPYPSQSAYDVFLMSAEGTNPLHLSDQQGQESVPSWTPDGKAIQYISWLFSGGKQSVPLYQQSPVPNAADRSVVFYFDTVGVPPSPVSVSPAGRLAAAAGGGIRTLNSDGSDVRLITPPLSTGLEVYSPAWAPDGQRIAFLSIVRDANHAIVSVSVVLVAPDGSAADTLVSLPAQGTSQWSGDNSYSLCWSPDGSQIAFTRPDGTPLGSHIYLIRKDHTGLTQVTFAAEVTDRSLSWSH